MEYYYNMIYYSIFYRYFVTPWEWIPKP